jgi:chaperonin cofactor prefoldin
VIDGGDYVGEALLSFTAPGGELVVPHAVELGITVREAASSSRQVHGLQARGSFLHVEEWEVRHREYQLNNATTESMTVLVEHPRTAGYDLFDTPEPEEMTGDALRFKVAVPEKGESTLRVQERRLVSRREELRKQSYRGLKRYLRQGLIDTETHAQLSELLGLWERISDKERALKETEAKRKKIFGAQQQIQGNMGALSATGKEGVLRARYVEQLEASEDELRALDARESSLQEEIERLKGEIRDRIQALG